MNHMELARAIRADTTVHYNCCQSVLIPFAEELGIDDIQANALGANFGAGMRMGATCGALTGALMVRRPAQGVARPGGAEKGPLRRPGLRDGRGPAASGGGERISPQDAAAPGKEARE